MIPGGPAAKQETDLGPDLKMTMVALDCSFLSKSFFFLSSVI